MKKTQNKKAQKSQSKAQLKIEYVPIDSVRLNPKNPRKIEETVEEVIDSMVRWGIVEGIIVNRRDRRIIAGNNRYLAFKKLGLKQIPVIFCNMSEIDADVLSVRHNKITERTPWDFAKLADLFVEFDQENVDLSATSFLPDEIKQIVLGPSGDKLPEIDIADEIVLQFDSAKEAEFFRKALSLKKNTKVVSFSILQKQAQKLLP